MGKGSHRPAERSDFAAIVEIYNRITRRSRTVAQHTWEWIDPPRGPGSSWVIEWEQDGRSTIIGHHGLIPIAFTFFGEELLAGKTENTFVDPAYRSKVLYFKYEKGFLEQASHRFDFLYTNWSPGSPGKIRRALGYSEVGVYGEYVRVIAPRIFTSGGSGHWNRGSCRMRGGNIVSLTLVRDFDELDTDIGALWECSKGAFGITASRSPEYLRWRIFGNPNVNYGFYIARYTAEPAEAAGYVVTENRLARHVRIVDVIAKNNDLELLKLILLSFLNHAANHGVCLVSCPTLLSGNVLNQALRATGFRVYDGMYRRLTGVAKQDTPVLLVKRFENGPTFSKFSNPDCWYHTDILGEGIRIPPVPARQKLSGLWRSVKRSLS